MKIGLIHDLYSPIAIGSVGGEDNLVDLEARLLSERGHDVKKIMRFYSGSQRKFRHLIVSATGRGMKPISESEIDSIDVIHTNNLSLVSGYSWLSESRVPIVSSFHNYRPLCPISIAWRKGSICFDCHDKSPFMSIVHGCGGKLGFLGAIRRGVLQIGEPEIHVPAHLIFTSNKMAQAYLSRNPLVNYDVIPNPSRLRAMQVNSSEGFSKLKPSGFLFAGRLTAEKGIIELIQNWPDEESLTIAGTGELQDQVEQLCNSRRNINYHGTFSPKDPYFYNQFESLVFPSSWLEGSPLVVIEAISSGVPVIATSTSSASELIDQSQCGVLMPQNFSQDDLRTSIHKIRVNRKVYMKNGIESGRSVFSPDNWIKNLENVFLKVLTK